VDVTERASIESYLKESADTLTSYAADVDAHATIVRFADVITAALTSHKKLMIAGNGGSAADAQHIAAEIISRLFFDRAPLPAIALTTDSSILTAIGNDYGYEKVFERQVLGLGNSGDVFLGISTSGKSRNILVALDAAKSKGIKTLGFTGAHVSPMNSKCDLVLAAPSTKTAVIQQVHIVAAHVICGLVERRIFAPALKAKAQ
jgi:D-sedoheptulose 7-phosphate isomerase